MKYAFILAQRHAYPVQRLCQVLEVSTSGLYAWIDRPESQRVIDNRRLLSKIRNHHRASREIYGSPWIHRDLIATGELVGVNRIARLMRTNGIQSRMAPKFVITTESRNTMAPASDRLDIWGQMKNFINVDGRR